MKYLKLRSAHYLDNIDLKTFSYPKMSSYKGKDSWDHQPYISAETWENYAPNTRQVYFEEYKDLDAIYPELRAEVDLWNTDPKKYWTEELIRLHELRITQLELNIAKEKDILKRTKKTLKKLQEKDA